MENIQQEWIGAVIVSILKKRNKYCNIIYRSISLVNKTSIKYNAKIIKEKLDVIRDHQAGFLRGRVNN